jgi:hypothetical protein
VLPPLLVWMIDNRVTMKVEEKSKKLDDYDEDPSKNLSSEFFTSLTRISPNNADGSDDHQI